MVLPTKQGPAVPADEQGTDADLALMLTVVPLAARHHGEIVHARQKDPVVPLLREVSLDEPHPNPEQFHVGHASPLSWKNSAAPIGPKGRGHGLITRLALRGRVLAGRSRNGSRARFLRAVAPLSRFLNAFGLGGRLDDVGSAG